MHLPEHLKSQATRFIGSNANWTVYSLASHLEVKAKEIYLHLDQKTRLMLIKENRLLHQHATEGLYPLAEKYRINKELNHSGTDTPSKGA